MAFSIARKIFYKFLGYSYLSTEKYVKTYSTSYFSTEKYVYITQTVFETLSLKTYAAVDFSILSIFRMIWVLKFTHLGPPIELKSDPSGKLDLSPQTSTSNASFRFQRFQASPSYLRCQQDSGH